MKSQKSKIFIEDLSLKMFRKEPLILIEFIIFGIFVPIYLIVLTGKLNMDILKFFLISCPVC